ncbi:prepilin-type N-terminal cleavage/methylation domain-containing protein [Halomonas sp. 18H]|uniref:PilW family protein n=1 Tax=Halomonas almeriensis TaxID=308163 RepID=UPI00222E5CBD|nr:MULTISPECIES: prepilin-type N-terminal cleavage/methylation domain-containing protein [Halomonas]MCW4149759.1 prepilin-type N-terminal cleavage/methylation domain-containing protein [Halomonas sp. 18H]MDN3553297.1 prepilin-type N-terminal cleavage/methylation domain-containing protein [Halomonas almeriensis]
MSAGRSAQDGVTLVELMVAMAIGMLVLLGAGRLYLAGVDSLGRVEALGQRQQSVMLGALFMLEEIRRGGVEPGRYELVAAPQGEGCSLRDSLSGEPLVDGLAATAGSCRASRPVEARVAGRDGLYRVRLRPLGEPAPVLLHGMDRQRALDRATQVAP